MEYLDGLNESQRKAVLHTEGPLMVIAGAGSGKTRVLTYRIAHLIRSGADPFNILSLTFTNKAAREMKERIEKIVGSSEARNIWMGTFHSVFAKILRSESERIGYPSNFTIYDTQDSKSLLKSIIKEMQLDDQIYKPNGVLGRISAAKNNLISAEAYLNHPEIQSDDAASKHPKIGQIYYNYAMRCFKAGAMDFDDLLFQTNILLRDHPDVLLKYQHKFRYILVDEYQDTNYSQYLIVRKLAAAHRNICVVGDDAQSIYSFRGANIQNILNFKKEFDECAVIKLEQNYRSTGTIVNAANSIIANNRDQLKKEVWTDNPIGDKIKVIKALSDNEEGRLVSNSIFEIQLQNQLQPKDFAILYRTNAQSRAFEESLRKLNLPYRIYGGTSFYQRKEIKDLLAYFRLTANHSDEESLKRIINYPKRGIGDTSLDKAAVYAAENDSTLWNVLEHCEQLPLGLNKGASGKILEFVTMIKSFALKLKTANAFEIGNEIAQHSKILTELYTDKTPEGVSRYENIQELLNGMKEFSESAQEGESRLLSDFLVDVALLTDVDEKDDDNNKVSLMTIHASKGLEFPYVYIVGLEENLFPSQMALNSRAELEEERRLFYVALTRAEKKATLSYATSRYRWGNQIYCEPSRFIEEINANYIELPEENAPIFQQKSFGFENVSAFRGFGSAETKSGFAPKAKPPIQSREQNPIKKPKNLARIEDSLRKEGETTDNSTGIMVGSSVLHEKFGKGKVLQLEGNHPNQKATIFFPSEGQKSLLLKFAKLTLLD
ncbi:MAG: ATP-dependent helicase [Flavobacteriales bacterium]